MNIFLTIQDNFLTVDSICAHIEISNCVTAVDVFGSSPGLYKPHANYTYWRKLRRNKKIKKKFFVNVKNYGRPASGSGLLGPGNPDLCT
jgi:hypothetical protein